MTTPAKPDLLPAPLRTTVELLRVGVGKYAHNNQVGFVACADAVGQQDPMRLALLAVTSCIQLRDNRNGVLHGPVQLGAFERPMPSTAVIVAFLEELLERVRQEDLGAPKEGG